MIRILVGADDSLIGAVEVEVGSENPEGMEYVGVRAVGIRHAIEVWREVG